MRDKTWEITPHQHKGPHQETGKDAHIYSPTKHNGAFNVNMGYSRLPD